MSERQEVTQTNWKTPLNKKGKKKTKHFVKWGKNNNKRWVGKSNQETHSTKTDWKTKRLFEWLQIHSELLVEAEKALKEGQQRVK